MAAGSPSAGVGRRLEFEAGDMVVTRSRVILQEPLVRTKVLRFARQVKGKGGDVMTLPTRKRCAIYTRKSTDEGLEMDFNSLDAQREACAAYILSLGRRGMGASQ